MPVGMYGGSSYSIGPSFFDMLFGGGRQVQQEPTYRPRGAMGRRAEDRRSVTR